MNTKFSTSEVIKEARIHQQTRSLFKEENAHDVCVAEHGSGFCLSSQDKAVKTGRHKQKGLTEETQPH